MKTCIYEIVEGEECSADFPDPDVSHNIFIDGEIPSSVLASGEFP
jgi:hypothetical protein